MKKFIQLDSWVTLVTFYQVNALVFFELPSFDFELFFEHASAEPPEFVQEPVFWPSFFLSFKNCNFIIVYLLSLSRNN